MGWADALKGTVIGMDTAPLIYYIETHPTYLPMVDPFFDALGRGEFVAVTSVVTLLEVLVHPIRASDSALADEYRDLLFNSATVSTLDVIPSIAEEAARLRAVYNLRTPDAIQLATAITASATHFLTNDARLKVVSGIQVLVLDELTP